MVGVKGPKNATDDDVISTKLIHPTIQTYPH